jgi:hypothetical protein
VVTAYAPVAMSAAAAVTAAAERAFQRRAGVEGL